MIKILTGLYSRYEGEIEIDGIPLSQLSEESRFSCFSILYQDFAKYQLTAAENIRIGNIGNDRETENSKEKEGDRKTKDFLYGSLSRLLSVKPPYIPLPAP